MIRTTMGWLQNKIFYGAWFLLHMAYQLQLEIRDYLRFNVRYVGKRLWSCFPLCSPQQEVVDFVESVSKLSKLPQHLGISVIPTNHESVLSLLWRKLWMSNPRFNNNNHKKDDDLKEFTYDSDGVNLLSVAKVVAWASAVNIPVISLYDYNGILKRRYKELGCYIKEEIEQDFWAVKQSRDVTEPPVVKFHNVHKANGYVNGHSNGHTNGKNGYSSTLNGTKSQETIHIYVYSRTDGKPAIVQAVKDIYTDKFDGKSGNNTLDSEQNGNVPSVPLPKAKITEHCVDETTLDSYLNRNNSWSSSIVNAKTEPELLMILGSVKSTLGFLPWHIRLTEIHWLPPLYRLELSDFVGSLFKYARCQQRFGK